MTKTLLATLAFILSFAATLFASEDNWFPWTAKTIAPGSPLDASEWLDDSAYASGTLQIDGDTFVFDDGRPVRFWGANMAFGAPFNPNREEVKQWAAHIARFGINAIRWHKFSNSGTENSPTATQIEPAKLKNMDYFNHQLAENGIYYGWSHIFVLKPRQEDRDRLMDYDEIINRSDPEKPFFTDGTTYAIASFFPDTQQLLIDHTVNLLNHRSSITGRRNADDPALIYIELQNEDNTFFGAADGAFKLMPNYRAEVSRLFASWLEERYGDEESFLAAWDGQGLEEGESLAQGIYPNPNHGWFGYHFDEAHRTGQPMPQHVLDRGRFLYDTQVDFYDRYVQAIRETGYRGTIVGSCWQAGSGITHFYNLHSDSLIDGQPAIIDRHNYARGRLAHVSRPQADLLSTGLQQVADRPFQLSEWLVTDHTQYSADATVMVAAYGMGLQGWDGSYSYCHNVPYYPNTIEAPNHGQWTIDTPIHIALYPALSRMVQRGDVVEGEVVSTRTVHLPSLHQGQLGFYETIEQDHDYKSFAGVVPPAAIGVGRVVVDFADEFAPTSPPDLSTYWDPEAKTIRSNTGQLFWDYSGDGDEKGFFTIDTPGTQAVVGFAKDKAQELGDIEVVSRTAYAVILATSLHQEKGIAEAPRTLLTTVARARNSEDKSHVAVEPVVLDLATARPGATLHVLSQEGSRTGKTIPSKGNRFHIDGSLHKTIYYELSFD